MPRSTAHSTGLVRAGVAEGALLGDHRGGLAAVLGVGREAVGGERLGDDVHGRRAPCADPRSGVMRDASERPYSSPTWAAIASASSGPSRCMASPRRRIKRSSRRCMRPSDSSSSTQKYRLEGRPAPPALRPVSTRR